MARLTSTSLILHVVHRSLLDDSEFGGAERRCMGGVRTVVEVKA